MRPESVARGTLILTASGIVTRVIGFAVRIILVRIMGPEGIGLFSRVSAMYMLILSFASAGIPVAVARLSAEELGRHSEASARRIADVAALVNIITGILAMLVFILFARPLSSAILRDIRLYPIMLAIAPALAVVPVSSVLRGLLQAYQWMTPIAASQMAERVASGIANVILAGALISHGVEYSAAGLASGMAIGEVVGLVAMAWAWHIYGKYPGDRRKSIKREAWIGPRGNMGTLPIMTRLFGIGIPVAGARAVGSFSGAVMAILVPERLMMAGFDIGKATAIYGSFQGIAMAIVFFPTVFTFSLSSNLIPAISRARGAGNWSYIRQRIKDSILITVLTGLTFTFFFRISGRFHLQAPFRYPGRYSRSYCLERWRNYDLSQNNHRRHNARARTYGALHSELCRWHIPDPSSHISPCPQSRPPHIWRCHGDTCREHGKCMLELGRHQSASSSIPHNEMNLV